MPPQQTKLTSESGRDAAGLRLASATADVLAEACPQASSVAAPAVASTRPILSLLERYWRAFRNWRRRERLRVSLHDLSERELMDIGLTSGEIDSIVAERTIERLRDSMRHL